MKQLKLYGIDIWEYFFNHMGRSAPIPSQLGTLPGRSAPIPSQLGTLPGRSAPIPSQLGTLPYLYKTDNLVPLFRCGIDTCGVVTTSVENYNSFVWCSLQNQYNVQRP